MGSEGLYTLSYKVIIRKCSSAMQIYTLVWFGQTVHWYSRKNEYLRSIQVEEWNVVKLTIT